MIINCIIPLTYYSFHLFHLLFFCYRGINRDFWNPGQWFDGPTNLEWPFWMVHYGHLPPATYGNCDVTDSTSVSRTLDTTTYMGTYIIYEILIGVSKCCACDVIVNRKVVHRLFESHWGKNIKESKRSKVHVCTFTLPTVQCGQMMTWFSRFPKHFCILIFFFEKRNMLGVCLKFALGRTI